jgi:hypothetical protein
MPAIDQPTNVMFTRFIGGQLQLSDMNYEPMRVYCGTIASIEIAEQDVGGAREKVLSISLSDVKAAEFKHRGWIDSERNTFAWPLSTVELSTSGPECILVRGVKHVALILTMDSPMLQPPGSSPDA